MTSEINLQVGGTLSDDLAAFSEAWRRGETGDLGPQRILSFESWEGLASIMTGERYRLLRHLHAQPAKSVNALALSLRRQYRRVHEDVTILEGAGLIVRSGGGVRTAVDRLSALVVL